MITPGNGLFSFKIASQDALGNQARSDCSPSISISSTSLITVTGAPHSVSNSTNLNAQVISTDPNFDSYAFVIVTNTNTCPSNGYGSWIAADTALTTDLSSYPDGGLTFV